LLRLSRCGALVPDHVPGRWLTTPGENGLFGFALVECAEGLCCVAERETVRPQLLYGQVLLGDQTDDLGPFAEREVPAADHGEQLADDLVAGGDFCGPRLSDAGHTRP